MRCTKRTIGMTTLLALVVVAGCSESSTGPEGPSVAGTWTGDFRGSLVRMSLTQRNDQVTGTLDVNGRSYAVAGTVTAGGVFSWSSDVAEADCTSYSSLDMQLGAGGTELNGVARRTSTVPPCGSSRRTLVEQGDMPLARAF